MEFNRPTTNGAMGRLVLALVVALLSVLLGSTAASFGAASALVAQPSPSGSGQASPTGPGEPSVAFLNPSKNTATDVPQVSDRPDNTDTDYHIVASTGATPPNAIVEASVTPLTIEGIPIGNEQTIGTLDPIPGTSSGWEYFWDIPSSLPEGDALMTVRLFTQTALGVEEVANDEIQVSLEHKNDNPPSGNGEFAAHTTELTWPTQNGPAGFYKPRGGAFRMYVDFTLAPLIVEPQTGESPENGNRTQVWYTVSDPGEPPVWTACGTGGVGATRVGCALVGRDLGSQVTALKGLARECTDVFCVATTAESSDVHLVEPFLVDPHEMTLNLDFRTSTDSPLIGRQLAGEHRPEGSEFCIAVQAIARDVLNRPVYGANVDYHIEGPNDQVQFGDEEATDKNGLGIVGNFSSTTKRPDKAGHQTEAGFNCDPRTDEADEPRTVGEQGDHNVPVNDDIKHRETQAGTGLDGGSGAPSGGHWIDIFSRNVGLTKVTAWIDNEPVPDDSVNPEADDDVLEPAEPNATVTAQWLGTATSILADPAGGSGAAGTCQKYTLKLRAGTTPVRDLNIDVHATGPTDDLDFCDPSDGSVRQAPDTAAAAHEGEDAKEASHAGASPRQQHTEGEADDAGNFVFGLMSPVAGDTTVTAWIDGTKGTNNDAPGAAPAEASVTFSHSWASSTGDVELSFINPSGYGGDAGAGGEEVSNKDDGGAGYHITTRVDAPQVVEGVEVLLGSNNTFSTIGPATRIGNSDTYELRWAVDVPDGDYTLRARVLGTTVAEDRTIRVNNRTVTTPPDEPNNQQAESAELTRPSSGGTAPFTRRVTTMEGKASAGAEGVYYFYTKAPAKDTPTTAAWTQCGFTDLNGTGTAVQDFKGECVLAGSDQASQVTGVAALTFDCIEPGGNAAPATQTNPRCAGGNDSGDAHRIFGFEAAPFLSLEPAETVAEVGTCTKLVLTIADQTGQALGNENVDIHGTGPEDEVDFCDPLDGSAHERNAPTEGGHEVTAGQEDQGAHDDAAGADAVHVEGRTTSSGRFIFGVASDQLGDTQLLAWIDRNDNDVHDGDEPTDTSIVHWEQESSNGGQSCDVNGTPEADTLEGTSASERICGFGGNDTIRGGGGNDVIIGGPGDDRLRGNAGGDLVKGGAGRDRVLGGNDGDRLQGNAGNDNVRGHGGNDRMDGGPGTDSCRGGSGKDRMRRCEGNSRRAAPARGMPRPRPV